MSNQSKSILNKTKVLVQTMENTGQYHAPFSMGVFHPIQRLLMQSFAKVEPDQFFPFLRNPAQQIWRENREQSKEYHKY